MQDNSMSPADIAKRAAAHRAAALVEDGMALGLGTGSTAAFLVRRLGERVREEGLRLRCVPTSRATADLAAAEGLEVTDLDDVPALDLTIDGADEADGQLDLIKGGGGALLREKIVASASSRMIVIADETKAVTQLGAFPLPVEVIAFGARSTEAAIGQVLDTLGYGAARIVLRQRGAAPFRTDEDNLLLDLHLGAIEDARTLHLRLLSLPGVVETGLFLGIASFMILGRGDGTTDVTGEVSGAFSKKGT